MRLIDADALISAVLEGSNNDGAYGYMDTQSIVDLIDTAPTIDPERKRGEWVNIQISANCYGTSSAECNLCGATVHSDFSSVVNYCPNCGAYMRGEK